MLAANDMIFSTAEDGTIMSGGFAVSSMILNKQMRGGGGPGSALSETFANLGVPSGLALIEYDRSATVDGDMSDSVISDDIYDRLLQISQEAADAAMATKGGRSRRRRAAVDTPVVAGRSRNRRKSSPKRGSGAAKRSPKRTRRQQRPPRPTSPITA